MGVLSCPYNANAFVKTPGFGEAVDQFAKMNANVYLEQIGQIFVKHGVHDKYGLILVHHHFSMKEDEILVEMIKSDISVAMPWVVNGNEAQPSDMAFFLSHGFAPEDTKLPICPESWAFNKETGRLEELEFLATDSEVKLPQSFPLFVDELFTKLKVNGLEELFALRRLNEKKDFDCWESTPHGVRANIIYFEKKRPLNEKFVDASWFFKENGDHSVVVKGWYVCTHGPATLE